MARGGGGGGGVWVWQCENANGGQTYAKRMPAGIVSLLLVENKNKRKCSSFSSVVLDVSDTAFRKRAGSELDFMPGLRIGLGSDLQNFFKVLRIQNTLTNGKK
jgi:hypothetical protein